MTPSESATLDAVPRDAATYTPIGAVAPAREVTYDAAGAAPMSNDGDQPGGMGCGAGARALP
jgi:hypothetical protein